MSTTLTDVRNSLNRVLVRLSDTAEGASSREVVQTFRAESPHLIRRASTDLEDATLVQMVSSLKRRKPPRSLQPINDLFASLDQVVVVNVVEEGKKKKKNKTPRKLTLIEAEACLADHKADRERNDHLIEILELLIEKARPFIVEGGTLEEGVAAADKSSGSATAGL